MGGPVPLRVALAPGVTAAFTTRLGGVSDPPYAGLNLGAHVGDDPALVARNREIAAAGLGVDLARTAWCEQVHGAGVAVVGPDQPGTTAPGADGLVTDLADVPLAVLVADCVPVLLADPRAGVVAAVHAGRRGLVAGVVQVAVGTALDTGARREDLVAVVGPSIGPCCYEVGPDVHDEVVAAVPAARARSRRGTPSLDLAAGVRRVLAEEGVHAVRAVGGCTAHQAATFYSHRRDGTTGRQAGMIWRR